MILKEEVQLQEEIGRGRYGVAFRGLYKGRVVAVKVSRPFFHDFKAFFVFLMPSRCRTLCAAEPTMKLPRRGLLGKWAPSVGANTQVLSG